MYFRALAIAIVAVVICSIPCVSQVGKLGLGVHASNVSSATEEDERVFDWGLHARARISNVLGIEGSLDFRTEEIEDSTLSLYPIQVSALFYPLPASRIGLYGLIGLGFTRSSASGSLFGEDAENTDFGYHWGFGAEIGSRGSAFFADIRYLDLNIDLSKIIVPDFNTKGWQFKFGYTYYF